MKRILGISLSILLYAGAVAFEDTSPFILAVSHKYIPCSETTDSKNFTPKPIA
jgi:hypothetical protein